MREGGRKGERERGRGRKRERERERCVGGWEVNQSLV